MFRQRLALFAAALWWGSLTGIGFMAVPLLFAHLGTPAMAGNMAAKLFEAQTWMSTGCGVFILLASRPRDPAEPVAWATRGVMSWLLAGVLLALLSQFAVSPRIVARENLALWHAVGSAMYLVQWVCAGGVLWRVGSCRGGPSPAAPS